MRAVSLMTAYQEFVKPVREVERGRGFPIIRRDRPVAKLVPHSAGKFADPVWTEAHRRLMARPSEGVSLAGHKSERAALHDCQGVLFSRHRHSGPCGRPRWR